MSDAVPPPKRFYQGASIVPSGNRYSVMLDDRPVKTRSGHPLSAPTKELGVEIAREWNSQKNVI
ncbi:MAG: ATP12 family protein, partial [Hyphococcus sp.]